MTRESEVLKYSSYAELSRALKIAAQKARAAYLRNALEQHETIALAAKSVGLKSNHFRSEYERVNGVDDLLLSKVKTEERWSYT